MTQESKRHLLPAFTIASHQRTEKVYQSLLWPSNFINIKNINIKSRFAVPFELKVYSEKLHFLLQNLKFCWLSLFPPIFLIFFHIHHTKRKKVVDALNNPFTFLISGMSPPLSFLGFVQQSSKFLLGHRNTSTNFIWKSSYVLR